MAFCLSGASQSFQRFINTAIRKITKRLPNRQEKDVCVFTYIDDILLEGRNHKTHVLELRAVFQHLTNFGLHISPLKCEFGATSMEFLGHLINQDALHLSRRRSAQ